MSSVALVTGAASGLGAATARRLLAAGFSVVGIDLNEERGNATFAELGEGAQFVKADVTSEDDVLAAIAVATDRGALRVAVSCAGIGWASRVVKRDGSPHPLDLFKKVIEVNLIGTFNVMRLTAAAMAKNDADDQGQRGVIVNTASVAAFEGQIGQVAYAASKGGVHSMTVPVARDLASKGIRVNTIAPGIFDTPMMAGLPEKIRDSLGASVPNPSRLGTPEEYADLVAMIAAMPYLNAETIRLDGGIRLPPR